MPIRDRHTTTPQSTEHVRQISGCRRVTFRGSSSNVSLLSQPGQQSPALVDPNMTRVQANGKHRSSSEGWNRQVRCSASRRIYWKTSGRNLTRNVQRGVSTEPTSSTHSWRPRTTLKKQARQRCRQGKRTVKPCCDTGTTNVPRARPACSTPWSIGILLWVDLDA